MSADNEKKVRAVGRPEEKTLREHKTAPTVPDGQAAAAVRELHRKRDAGVPLAPLDIDSPRRRK